jgi:hypothetical protein
MAASQRPFDPYRAGAKVYLAYQAGGRPAPQTTLSVVDFQPKTQRSGRENTKCKHTVSNPNYSTGIGWKWGKRGRAPSFISKTLKFCPPLKPRPLGPVAARRVSTRGRAVTGTRVRATSVDDKNPSVGKTASAGWTRMRADVRMTSRMSKRNGRPDGNFYHRTSV